MAVSRFLNPRFRSLYQFGLCTVLGAGAYSLWRMRQDRLETVMELDDLSLKYNLATLEALAAKSNDEEFKRDVARLRVVVLDHLSK